MHKTSWVFTCYAFITGAFSMFLRWLQNKNCFEPETGLFVSGSAITVFLVLLLGVSAAGMLAIALTKKTVPVDAETALHAKSPLCTIGAAVLGVALLAGSLALFITAGATKLALLYRLLAILGVAAAVSAFFAVNRMTNGTADAVSCFCFVVIVLFYCFWLIVCYKSHDSDPVIWRYAPELLAIAASLLAWYYLAGIPFGRAKPANTIFFCGLSFVLSLVSMPDDRSAALSVMLLSPSVITLMLAWLMLRNLYVKNKH